MAISLRLGWRKDHLRPQPDSGCFALISKEHDYNESLTRHSYQLHSRHILGAYALLHATTYHAQIDASNLSTKRKIAAK